MCVVWVVYKECVWFGLCTYCSTSLSKGSTTCSGLFFGRVTYVPGIFLDRFRNLQSNQLKDGTERAERSPRKVEDQKVALDGLPQEDRRTKRCGEPLVPHLHLGFQSLDVTLVCLSLSFRVTLLKMGEESFGMAVVGGRGIGHRLSNGEIRRGVFIKHVTEGSPASRTLKVGDQILQVSLPLVVTQCSTHTLVGDTMHLAARYHIPLVVTRCTTQVPVSSLISQYRLPLMVTQCTTQVPVSS